MAVSTAPPKSFTGTLVSKNHRGSACSVDEDRGGGAFSVDEDRGGSACTRARAATGRRGAGLCSAGSLESRVHVLPVHLQGGVRGTCCLWSCRLHR